MRSTPRHAVPLSLACLLAASGCAGLSPGMKSSQASEKVSAPLLKRGMARAIDGTKLFYVTAGEGPPLILIHGLGGNHAVWFNQVPVFAATRRVVAISQRGFAPSNGGQRNYEPEVLAADLIGVMDALGIERADIVGQSMGGWTALGMAVWYPDRVRSIILADSLAGISDDEIADDFTAMMRQAREFAETPARIGVHPAVDAGFARHDPASAYLYQALAMFGAPSPARIGPQLGAFRFDPAALARNRIPALFVVGERDRIFTPATVRKAAAYLAGSRVVEIPDTGHSPYFEKPRQWNRVVETFLGERP